MILLHILPIKGGSGLLEVIKIKEYKRITIYFISLICVSFLKGEGHFKIKNVYFLSTLIKTYSHSPKFQPLKCRFSLRNSPSKEA